MSRVTSFFSSINRKIESNHAELYYFIERLTMFFFNFKEFYTCLAIMKEFIDVQIKQGDDTNYERFIDETISEKYKEYYLQKNLITSLELLRDVYLLIVPNAKYKDSSLQMFITPKLTKELTFYNGLQEYTTFFENAKDQIDAYERSTINVKKQIDAYKNSTTNTKPLILDVRRRELGDDEEPSTHEEPYYAGGNQSTKKIRMPAKRRRSLLKSTREKNKARRRKPRNSRKPRKPRNSRKPRKPRNSRKMI